MKYCNNCLLPDSRPGLKIHSDGICNACKNSIVKKEEINWEDRELIFKQLVGKTKSISNGYDCLIPVSGGKDSTWQVLKCLEYGLKPLCFSWRPPSRTKLGQINLDNLISLGVDHIDYSISPKTEKKFLLESLKRYGAVAIPMHMAIFNIAPKLAINFNIPLIIWGENSAFEYGSEDKIHEGFSMDEAWIKTFGVVHGTTYKDWINDDLTIKDLEAYKTPNYDLLNKKEIKAIFLGQYFKWDPEITANKAREYGFKFGNQAKVGFYDYADLDDNFISVHHFPKWHKFGFSRIFDNLSLEIRNGRISRNNAIEILKNKGPEIPMSDIKLFCKYVGIEIKDFFQIIEKFRNHNIWHFDNGTWKINDFIIENWNWKKLQYEN